MSLIDLLTVVNSDPKSTLNHIFWLNDYKTYGEESYVFKDKDMLDELYHSPMCANDSKVFNDAINYILDNDVSFIGSFLRNVYELRKYDSFVDCSSMADLANNMDFLNVLANNATLRNIFISKEEFVSTIQSSNNIVTITSPTTNNFDLSVSNALIVGATAGCAYITIGTNRYYRPGFKTTDLDGVVTQQIASTEQSYSGSPNSISKQLAVFVKSAQFIPNNINGLQSYIDSSISYIPLDISN